jgi:hypothetical protein
MEKRALSNALCLPLSLAAMVLIAGCGGGGGGSSALASAPVPVPTTVSRTTTSMPPMHTETPTQADAFVSSIGVNVHLSYYGTPYGDNFSLILQRLKALGVRHVRDGMAVGQNNLCSEYAQLAGAGIHVDALTSVSTTSANLSWWASCVGSALEAFEGPNEYDQSGDPNWAFTLTQFQSTLYQTVKASFPGVAVIAPALTSSTAYQNVNFTSDSDFGNMHDYFSGRNPGTTGWGSTSSLGTYGSLSYSLSSAKQSTASEPIIATETGYADKSADTNWVPATVKMHYTLRTLLDQWNAGVARTDLYELLDEGGPPFSSYGLLDSAGNAKPAYTALANLIAHLADPGPAFTPTAGTYGISASSSVWHALFQRRNGSFCLALWVEAPEWDPTTSTPIAITPQTVVLGLQTQPKLGTVTTFNDTTGAVTTSTLYPAADGTVTLSVTGGVMLVDVSF